MFLSKKTRSSSPQKCLSTKDVSPNIWLEKMTKCTDKVRYDTCGDLLTAGVNPVLYSENHFFFFEKREPIVHQGNREGTFSRISSNQKSSKQPSRKEGRHQAEYERLQSDHGFGVPVRGTDLRANVVQSYEHFGGVLQSNFSNMMFVDKPASCPMTTCVSIAGRVFSSPCADVMCKPAFARTLTELTAVNMLVRRRIVDHSRSDDTADSDLDVRVRNHIESSDCVLSPRLPGYLARLARQLAAKIQPNF